MFLLFLLFSDFYPCWFPESNQLASELVPLHRLEESDASLVWRWDTQLKVIPRDLDDDFDDDLENGFHDDLENDFDDDLENDFD